MVGNSATVCWFVNPETLVPVANSQPYSVSFAKLAGHYFLRTGLAL